VREEPHNIIEVDSLTLLQKPDDISLTP
jgi:hypothetical protein